MVQRMNMLPLGIKFRLSTSFPRDSLLLTAGLCETSEETKAITYHSLLILCLFSYFSRYPILYDYHIHYRWNRDVPQNVDQVPTFYSFGYYVQLFQPIFVSFRITFELNRTIQIGFRISNLTKSNSNK